MSGHYNVFQIWSSIGGLWTSPCLFLPAIFPDMGFVHEAETYRVLNREVFLLIALAVGGIGVFAFTRGMAAREQQMEARIAAIWYREGERQLSSGEVDRAIDSFRKATTNAAGSRTYALGLANALASWQPRRGSPTDIASVTGIGS